MNQGTRTPGTEYTHTEFELFRVCHGDDHYQFLGLLFFNLRVPRTDEFRRGGPRAGYAGGICHCVEI